MLVIPYLFIPVNWQKQITSSINAGDPEGTATFSAKYFLKHFRALGDYWFDWNFVGYPTQLPVTLLAVFGLFLLIRNTQSKGTGDQDRHSALLSRWVLGIGLLGVVGLFLPQLFYYMGNTKEPWGHRFAISYAPAVAFLAAYGLWVLFKFTKKGLFIPGVAVVLMFIGTSHAARNPLGKTLVLFREYKEFLHFVRQQPRTGTLIVADRPGMYVVHGYGAISFETLRGQVDEWKSSMERRLYTNVIAEQQIFYDSSKPPFPALPEGFTADTLYEFQNDSEYFMRFSRLKVAEDLSAIRFPKGRGTKSSEENSLKDLTDAQFDLRPIPHFQSPR
jgi:hypothetical protein